MWFAARDLVFGKDAYPLVEAPTSISREVDGREMPQIPEGLEQLIRMLMNVLMIEVRAESFFALCCRLFRDPELFTDRREEAELAALIVERIRADEASHVGYLQVVVSELRSFTWRVGGKTCRPGDRDHRPRVGEDGRVAWAHRAGARRGADRAGRSKVRSWPPRGRPKDDGSSPSSTPWTLTPPPECARASWRTVLVRLFGITPAGGASPGFGCGEGHLHLDQALPQKIPCQGAALT